MTTIRPAATAAVARTSLRPVSTFPGTVKEIGWSPGSGVRRPDGVTAYMGFFADVMVNPSTKTSAKMKIDAAKKTITVTLTGKAGRPNHAADQLRHLKLGTPNGMQMGQNYKLIVVDSAGHVLAHKNVRPMPAA